MSTAAQRHLHNLVSCFLKDMSHYNSLSCFSLHYIPSVDPDIIICGRGGKILTPVSITAKLHKKLT